MVAKLFQSNIIAHVQTLAGLKSRIKHATVSSLVIRQVFTFSFEDMFMNKTAHVIISTYEAATCLPMNNFVQHHDSFTIPVGRPGKK